MKLNGIVVRDLEPILYTVHGSHLYGTNHENSDLDMYSVYPGKGKSAQHVALFDITVHFADRFKELCLKGTPQALEALWSPMAQINENYLGYLEGITVNHFQGAKQHFSTAYSMLNNKCTIKSVKHAVRITSNGVKLYHERSYNPRLTDKELDYLKSCPDDLEEAIKWGKASFNALTYLIPQ